MNNKVKIRNKISYIIGEENLPNAIERVSGYLEAYFWDQWILDQLARLHYKNGNMVLAGRFWYFKKEKSQIEMDCIELYKLSKGNDLIHITRELIGHYFKSPRYLNTHTKKQLYKMIEKIRREKGFIPKFSKNWYHHIKKQENNLR